MFIGHYGVSFAAKRAEPSVPLWVLFLSVQLLDVIWGPLVLLGVERVQIVPGLTEANALDFVYYPYTHSLVAAVVWGIVAGVLYHLIAKPRTRSAALIVGLAVFSHWPLDLIMHSADLPLYDNAAKVGFGLWNSRPLSYSVEVLTVLIGFRLFLASRREGMLGTLIFVLALVALQGFFYYGPVPESVTATAWSALGGYLLLAAIIWWLQDRRRSSKPA